ncbi:hypothetical protein [Candidatus Methanodesulfokora washburnensis]|nr:hypothetical protein [Candidatus Methanodesulfokores washburnensis]
MTKKKPEWIGIGLKKADNGLGKLEEIKGLLIEGVKKAEEEE